jgi:hypothetical protein
MVLLTFASAPPFEEGKNFWGLIAIYFYLMSPSVSCFDLIPLVVALKAGVL